MISGLVRTAVAAFACVLALAPGALADTHDDGDGRLSASSGAGGFVADAPVHHAYWVSFGDWVLCDTAADSGTPADAITITGVRYVTHHPPLRVRAYLRTVTPHQVAGHPGRPDGEYSPFTANVGRPPSFDQRYADADRTPRGSYTRDVADTVVSGGCEQAVSDAFADAQGKVPEHSWMGLVLAIKVGQDTARVRRTLVDYTIAGEPHTLRISWVVGGQGYDH